MTAVYPQAATPMQRRADTGSLRVATCLAPHLCWFYRFVARWLGDHAGRNIEFIGDADYEHLVEADLAFVCSLAYLEHPVIAGRFEPLAAPILAGERYAGRPIYYSDVIVHAESNLRTFAQLRGRSWAFNEPYSQSGHGITRYYLARLGETHSFFAKITEAGRHDRAMELVATRTVDAAAIDSHLLETYLAAHPQLASSLRVIDSLGPSPIQPLVVRRSLPRRCKADLLAALQSLEWALEAQPALSRARVARFVPVDDSTYEPVRAMRDHAAAAGLPLLH
jgi:phosphonate transport system substrate-binding protein